MPLNENLFYEAELKHQKFTGIKGPTTMLEQPHFTFADNLWSRISRKAFFSRIFMCSSGNENHAIEQPH
jgi:hypothetical protein